MKGTLKMANNIIGIIKFSSNKKLDNGSTPFEDLKKGNIFFNDPSLFSKNTKLGPGQKAVEGSVKSTIIKDWTNHQIVNNNSFETPKGFIFNKSSKIIQIVSTFKSSPFLGYKNNINLNSLSKYYNANLSNEYDLFLSPVDYYQNAYYDKSKKKLITDYLIKNAQISYGKDSTCKISCFATIKRKDIINGHLKKQYIDDISEIAEDRNWVYINFSDFLKELRKINFKGNHGIVTYYQDIYPLTQNEISFNPNKIFFFKPNKYQNQHEYRLVIGGPNKSYKNPYGKILHLNWKSKIQYSNIKKNNLESLSELRF